MAITWQVAAPDNLFAQEALGMPHWTPYWFRSELCLPISVEAANRAIVDHWTTNVEAVGKDRADRVAMLATAAGVLPELLRSIASISITYRPWTLAEATEAFTDYLRWQAIRSTSAEFIFNLSLHPLADSAVLNATSVRFLRLSASGDLEDAEVEEHVARILGLRSQMNDEDQCFSVVDALIAS